MGASTIVKSEVVTDASERLGHSFVVLQVYFFVLEASPQPLDEHIVDPAAPTVHADSHTLIKQEFCEEVTGELSPLLRVEDLGGAIAVEGLHAEVVVQGIGEPPRERLSTVPIHDGHQVQEPSCHGNIANIGTPDLVRPVDCQGPGASRDKSCGPQWAGWSAASWDTGPRCPSGA